MTEKLVDNKFLFIVGFGIKFLSHLTVESKVVIEKADMVLYLSIEPAMEEWIKKNSQRCQTLDFLYGSEQLRKDSYQAITDYILNTLSTFSRVCVVFDGHPTVFASSALKAAKIAKNTGVITSILPGISAEDCLFADLMIDPSSVGCISHDATEFLVHNRIPDITRHLILWQVSMTGVLGFECDEKAQKGIDYLKRFLQRFYAGEHSIYLYRAAQYPGFEPKIIKLFLSELTSDMIDRIATLYVPPSEKPSINHDFLSTLSINVNELITQ